MNEEGQVHTYLCYLADLPYEEQLYWKSFNEKPNGSISRRAYETDFEGRWSNRSNPAEALKHLLEDAKNELPFLFLSLTAQDIAKLHRVLTDNRKQWGDALLQLDQTIVESLDKKQVQEKAKELGCLDRKLGGIKQLQEVLQALSYHKDEIEVLVELHSLRSKVVGHKSGSEAKQIIKDIRKQHRTFPVHFDDLLKRVGASIKFLIDHKDELIAKIKI